MTALSEALAAAQSRAVAALGKQYVGGQLDAEDLRVSLAAIGLRDSSDTDEWLAALDVIRETGAALPRENGNGAPDATTAATEAQWSLVRKLAGEKNQPVPDGPLTKAQAHEVIDTLKAGTYDAGRWVVPF